MQLKTKAIAIGVLLCTTGCTSYKDNRVVLDGYSGFTCPAPNTIKYEAWGENGLSKACLNARALHDGSFWTVESEHFFLRGQYKNGKESGTWEYLDKKGAVTRKVMGS